MAGPSHGKRTDRVGCHECHRFVPLLLLLLLLCLIESRTSLSSIGRSERTERSTESIFVCLLFGGPSLISIRSTGAKSRAGTWRRCRRRRSSSASTTRPGRCCCAPSTRSWTARPTTCSKRSSSSTTSPTWVSIDTTDRTPNQQFGFHCLRKRGSGSIESATGSNRPMNEPQLGRRFNSKGIQ